VPLFEALAADPRMQLRVLFMDRSEPNRSWEVPQSLRFDHEFLPGMHSVWLRGAFTFHANPSVLRALARFDPDCVVVGGWDSLTTFLAARYASRKRRDLVVWSESNALGRSGSEGFRAWPKRWLLGCAQAGLVPGLRAREYLVSLGAAQLPIWDFPNVVDTSAFALDPRERESARSALRAELGLRGTVFVFVGQLVERKGLPELLEAFAAAVFSRDASLLVVGDGPLRALAESRAAESRPGRRIVALPFRQQQEIAALYAASDALVLPSREDPWPLVVVEAMTAGLPVLASDAVGNAADLIEPGQTGFVFRARDAAALARSFEQAERSELARLGARARERVIRTCSLERCVESFARAVGAIARA
jgi:glycosyltransferase involved in cell wall biosynthesis